MQVAQRLAQASNDKEGKEGKNNEASGTMPPFPYLPYFPLPPGQSQGANSAATAAAMFSNQRYPFIPPQLQQRLAEGQNPFPFPPDFKGFPTGIKFPFPFPKPPLSDGPSLRELKPEKKVFKRKTHSKDDNRKEVRRKKKNKSLYCICQRPEDGDFMVGCDVCDNWFHPKCVNISKKVAKTLDYFLCPHCLPFVPEEDLKQVPRCLTHHSTLLLRL